jgi:hypothetical protein
MRRPPRYQIGSHLAVPSGEVGEIKGVFDGADLAVRMIRCWRCDRQDETTGVHEEFALTEGYVYLLALPHRQIGFVAEDQAKPSMRVPEALLSRAPNELYQQEGRRERLARRRPRQPKPAPPVVPEGLQWRLKRITPRQLAVLQAVATWSHEGQPTVRLLAGELKASTAFSVHSLVADLAKRGLLTRGHPGLRLTPAGVEVVECQPSHQKSQPQRASEAGSPDKPSTAETPSPRACTA